MNYEDDRLDDERCEICGEIFSESDARAEMVEPGKSGTVLVHAECGLEQGMEVS